jgi:two-component system, cell cycle sensor histidine kinase and response regulator CckA
MPPRSTLPPRTLVPPTLVAPTSPSAGQPALLETYARILDSIADAAVAIDAQWRITYANRAAERIADRPRMELIGADVWHVVPAPLAAALEPGLRRAARDQVAVEFEQHMPGLDRWLEVRIHPAVDGVVLYCRDVTERRQQQDALRRSEAELRHTQKMEAVGRLAGGIAHDFNNLLTAIKGYSDLILVDLAAATEGRIDVAHLRDDVEQIRNAANRAATLTSQMLAFGRRQVLQPRPIDLNACVADMEKMLRRVISEDIEMRLVFATATAGVTADRPQIEQVVMNIVLNARDAMPEGGKLTIETRPVTLDASYAARHVGVTPGDYVMLGVSDTGHGMDAPTQARLFEPFFTTKETGKASGLGLATAYGIVKQSGGNIGVYSEPGIGTTVKVYLPRTDGASSPDSPAAESPSTLTGWETILVVEDENAVRLLVCGVLGRCGYKVLAADDGLHAVRVSEAYEAPIHLLLTDVVMPGMGGIRLADRLSAARGDMRILYMSGYTEHAIVHHGVFDPGTAFIEKPFTPDQLARKVRMVLG